MLQARGRLHGAVASPNLAIDIRRSVEHGPRPTNGRGQALGPRFGANLLDGGVNVEPMLPHLPLEEDVGEPDCMCDIGHDEECCFGQNFEVLAGRQLFPGHPGSNFEYQDLNTTGQADRRTELSAGAVSMAATSSGNPGRPPPPPLSNSDATGSTESTLPKALAGLSQDGIVRKCAQYFETCTSSGIAARDIEQRRKPRSDSTIRSEAFRTKKREGWEGVTPEKAGLFLAGAAQQLLDRLAAATTENKRLEGLNHDLQAELQKESDTCVRLERALHVAERQIDVAVEEAQFSFEQLQRVLNASRRPEKAANQAKREANEEKRRLERERKQVEAQIRHLDQQREKIGKAGEVLRARAERLFQEKLDGDEARVAATGELKRSEREVRQLKDQLLLAESRAEATLQGMKDDLKREIKNLKMQLSRAKEQKADVVRAASPAANFYFSGRSYSKKWTLVAVAFALAGVSAKKSPELAASVFRIAYPDHDVGRVPAEKFFRDRKKIISQLLKEEHKLEILQHRGNGGKFAIGVDASPLRGKQFQSAYLVLVGDGPHPDKKIRLDFKLLENGTSEEIHKQVVDVLREYYLDLGDVIAIVSDRCQAQLSANALFKNAQLALGVDAAKEHTCACHAVSNAVSECYPLVDQFFAGTLDIAQFLALDFGAGLKRALQAVSPNYTDMKSSKQRNGHIFGRMLNWIASNFDEKTTETGAAAKEFEEWRCVVLAASGTDAELPHGKEVTDPLQTGKLHRERGDHYYMERARLTQEVYHLSPAIVAFLQEKKHQSTTKKDQLTDKQGHLLTLLEDRWIRLWLAVLTVLSGAVFYPVFIVSATSANAYDWGEHLQQALAKLRQWIVNPTPLLTKDTTVLPLPGDDEVRDDGLPSFPKVDTRGDMIEKARGSLRGNMDKRAVSDPIISLLLRAFVAKLEDHQGHLLPGGALHRNSLLKQIPAHNNVCEQMFGVLKDKARNSPTASPESLGAEVRLAYGRDDALKVAENASPEYLAHAKAGIKEAADKRKQDEAARQEKGVAAFQQKRVAAQEKVAKQSEALEELRAKSLKTEDEVNAAKNLPELKDTIRYFLAAGLKWEGTPLTKVTGSTRESVKAEIIAFLLKPQADVAAATGPLRRSRREAPVVAGQATSAQQGSGARPKRAARRQRAPAQKGSANRAKRAADPSQPADETELVRPGKRLRSGDSVNG